MRQNRAIVFLAILTLIIIAESVVWFRATHKTSPKTPEQSVNFSADGNVIRNNPGLKPGAWFFVYEKPGAPALNLELIFDHTPTPTLTQGERVHIEGNLTDSILSVTSLSPISSSTEFGEHIKLYFYNPKLDQGPGGAQCSRKGLVSVERIIPQTQTPLQDSIKLLLRGQLSEEERTQGITTEFPLPGFALIKAEIENGTATLTFSDPQNKTSGGSCRVGILWFQIEATAKQFTNVKTVRFLPEDLFQP